LAHLHLIIGENFDEMTAIRQLKNISGFFKTILLFSAPDVFIVQFS
jgi:hypothetical protein